MIYNRKLNKDDAGKFSEYYLAEVGDKQPIKLIDGKDPQDPENWKRAMIKFSIFGLFNDERLIGFSIITHKSENDVVFSGTNILPEYRGQKLSGSLYEVRKNYLREQKFVGQATTKIMDNNFPSLKAASQAGFTPVAEEDVEGETHKNVVLELKFQ